MRNIIFNKKRIASFLLALGIGLWSHCGLAELFSYNNKTTLKDGREVKIYFTTGDAPDDYGYISLENMVGYTKLSNLNLEGLTLNSDYTEYQRQLIITADSANVYQTPNMDQNIISTLNKNDVVHTAAKNNDGWYVIGTNDLTGFMHESSFIAKKNETKSIVVTGNNVNIRLTPDTSNKGNIVGSAYKGDEFELISINDGWCLINYYGTNAYISAKYAEEITSNEIINNVVNTDQNKSQVNMAKITGNNVNVRSSADSNANNVIGFADITDYFTIIDKQGDWYVIDYLGKTGYISSKYVKETLINAEDTKTISMVYLTCSSYFYKDTNGTYLTTLPEAQLAEVIKQEGKYYRVRVDGVIGYIEKNNTKKLTDRFIASFLGRQICKVYKDNKEVYRAHIISGRKGMETDPGKYKIGHMLKDYQLTPDKRVNYWIQYHGNEGFHDAYWQVSKKSNNFVKVAKDAYERFSRGKDLAYPTSHGSHGCDNLQEEDASVIYSILRVGDDVLIILPNTMVRDNIISSLKDPGYILVGYNEKEKVKILV